MKPPTYCVRLREGEAIRPCGGTWGVIDPGGQGEVWCLFVIHVDTGMTYAVMNEPICDQTYWPEYSVPMGSSHHGESLPDAETVDALGKHAIRVAVDYLVSRGAIVPASVN